MNLKLPIPPLWPTHPITKLQVLLVLWDKNKTSIDGTRIWGPHLVSAWFSFLMPECHPATKLKLSWLRKMYPLCSEGGILSKKVNCSDTKQPSSSSNHRGDDQAAKPARSITAPRRAWCQARDIALAPKVGGPVSSLWVQMARLSWLMRVANEKWKVIRRFNSEREANMLWRRWSREGGGGTAKGPEGARNSRSTYNRKQRNFTCSVVLMHQQNSRRERQTDGEKIM